MPCDGHLFASNPPWDGSLERPWPTSTSDRGILHSQQLWCKRLVFQDMHWVCLAENATSRCLHAYLRFSFARIVQHCLAACESRVTYCTLAYFRRTILQSWSFVPLIIDQLLVSVWQKEVFRIRFRA